MRQDKSLRAFLFVGLGILAAGVMRPEVFSQSATEFALPSETASLKSFAIEQQLQHQTYSRSNSTVHVLQIQAQGPYAIIPALSPNLETVADFAQRTGAIAVLNAGFFDPQTTKTTSYIIIQGELVADPRLNEGLMGNPNLTPYMSQILNRSEFRRYDCQGETRYDIVFHNAPTPPDCERVDAVGAGPQLLPAITAVEEGFIDYADGIVIRDPLGSHRPNARTAVGLTQAGDVIWAMVAQKPDAPTDSGMSFEDLANFLQELGVEKAMNLDGGSSSSLYYDGVAYHGRVDPEGRPIRRPVKSVLLIQRKN